jgi:hypothetical protein
MRRAIVPIECLGTPPNHSTGSRHCAFTGQQPVVGPCERRKKDVESKIPPPVSDSGELKPFEGLLHVKVIKGVPVEAELISLRKIAVP